MKGRNAQVSRVYRMLNILEGAPHGLSPSELESRLKERGFDVSTRTIYRDLEALRAAGFPMNESGKSDKMGTRWTLERVTKVSHYLVLTSRELLALYLARMVLEPLRDTPFYEDLQTTFGKIEEKLGEKGQTHLNEVSHEMHFEPGPRWGLGIKPEIVDTVRAACTEGQYLSINYSSTNSGTTRDRKIGPEFLYFAKGSLYLVGKEEGESTNKIFSVPRMNKATMLNEGYQAEQLDPDKFFAGSFGIYHAAEAPERVSIEFGSKIAAFVSERRWHPSQRVVSKEHGKLVVELEVALTPELVQWVLGFGAQAKVLAPAKLARQVFDEAEGTAARYRLTQAAG